MIHLLAYIFPLSASQDSEGYTYKVPFELWDDIGIGDLVTIPFREDTQEWIVADLREVSDISDNELEDLKTLQSIRFPAILSFAQIKTIEIQAKELCVHIHKVLALFLPAMYIKRIFKHQDFKRAIPIKSYEIFDENKNLQLCYIWNQKELVIYARNFLAIPGSVVIAPNQRYIDEILQEIPQINNDVNEEFIKKISIYPADATNVQKIKIFIEARIGESKSIIGGRRLIFCNLSRFNRILYLEDGLFKEVYHSFHKYRIFDMLSLMARFSSHQTFFVASVTPSIEVASLAIAKKIWFESFIQQ